MAEIKIKKKSPVWPWILVIVIVLAAMAYYFMVYADSDRGADGPNIGQDEQSDNDTGQNSHALENDYSYLTFETVA